MFLDDEEQSELATDICDLCGCMFIECGCDEEE